MAFFDDIGKKLSQATQATAQKAKELADVTRINGAISDEEKKINNNYYQIGKLYVAMHSQDHEADFAGFISSIKESERKITDYRSQVQKIKGITKCEKCGAEVAMNMAFCSSCGSPMPKNAANQGGSTIKCTGCGQSISKDVRFCTSCGKPMAEIVQYYAPVHSEPEPQEAPVTEETTQAQICPGCGAEITDEMLFCTECGIKLK